MFTHSVAFLGEEKDKAPRLDLNKDRVLKKVLGILEEFPRVIGKILSILEKVSLVLVQVHFSLTRF